VVSASGAPGRGESEAACREREEASVQGAAAGAARLARSGARPSRAPFACWR